VPIVCTSGDGLAARIERDDLGATAAPGDVDGVAAGLARMLDGDRMAYGERLGRAARELTWPRTAAPLVAFLGSLPTGASTAVAAGSGARAPHPARALRTAGYAAARPLLNLAGLRDWPRV
jgi:hypothetical protein